MQVIIPKNKVPPSSDPLFFLMGPIRGGDDWHLHGALEIEKYVPDARIAIPCRYTDEHHLFPRQITSTEKFPRQMLWERYYLEQAGILSERGCILVWLPCESKTKPREDGHPYARDTYGELGEWRGRMMSNPNIRLVIGAEKDFHGLDLIHRNCEAALERPFPIYPTLEATVQAAIAMVFDQSRGHSVSTKLE